ncbi:hypothetical protein FRD01_04405 [Microvenator marinus]|jgi:hypothetical protein|uniref:Uncharacterized protein n=1 Tax=Microvenator marinus TaxID=2600177 RepID=A0A5B8XL22_9DELT|nr:hypothetical protein [Microvenator marinus]QED26500.1 hypothetical protein FRD01_04405 [Microvenator marinus]
MAFEPPSDFVTDSGSSKKTIWKVLGVGCLLILLIIGGFFAAGTFKMVSCCSDISDAAKSTMAGQEFGKAWVSEVAGGNIDSAFSQTTPSFQEGMSKESFASKVKEHESWLANNVARVRDTNVLSQGDAGWKWRIFYQFSKPGSEQMLVLILDVVQVEEKFLVDAVDFDVRERLMSAEPPAQAVLDFHDLIQGAEYEVAFGRLSDGFKSSTNQDAFRKFLDAEGAVLKGSTLEIKDVIYNAQDSATVMAFAENKSGAKAIVQYELSTPMPNFPTWQIDTISPMLQGESEIEVENDAPETEVESESASENE